MNTRAIGKRGEARAVEYLNHLGYLTIAAPAILGGVEVDALMLDGETLVLVEVKYRGTNQFGTPATAVNRAKRARMSRAGAYLTTLSPRDVRFDVVEVTPDGITHHKGAFAYAP